jgi:hypothetical protein
MRRKKGDGLKARNTPRQRRSYLDYDYIQKLNQEERDFLEKFSSEFYGADFEINATYIKENGEYVQISGNMDPSKNRDLRKYRQIRKYYLGTDGIYHYSKQFKYTKNNIHSEEEQRKSCNQNANANARDLMAIGHPAEVAKEEFQYFLENLQEGMSPEEMLVLRETVEEKLREGEE